MMFIKSPKEAHKIAGGERYTVPSRKQGPKPSVPPSPPSVDVRLFLVAIGIVFYFFLFFQSSFGPLAEFVSCRAFLLTLLFDPALFIELWCGNPAQFAVLDRIPLFFSAGCCLLAAYGLGQFTLRILRITEFLDALESYVFSTAIGLSLFSTFLLMLGLSGLAGQCWLVRGLTVIPAIYGTWTLFSHCRPPSAVCRLSFAYCPPSALLVIPYLLAFPLPPVEYDVVSYHLPGVKETFLTGDFGFRTDSVYTNMPFGAEMYYLWGMLLYGDWYHGALAGKITVGFAGSLLPAAALFAFGRRFFTSTVGIIAAVLYLTTPWVYYVSATGLIDCVVATYVFLAIYALAVFHDSQQPRSLLFLSGFLAGSAVSCKYPALLFVVVPLAVAVGRCSISRNPQNLLRNIVLFSLAVLLACGLWFGKNAVFTGNPTYPLLHNVFGDRTGSWTPEKNARWTRVHSPHDFTLASAYKSATQILWKSDYHSPILVPFAVIGLVSLLYRRKHVKEVQKKEDRLLFALAAHIVFVLFCWWFLTHRLDRFWVPILPLVAMIAAWGAVLSSETFWKRTVLVAVGVTVAYSMLVAVLPQPGKYNRFFLPMQVMRADPIRVMPWTRYYNENPPQAALLLIGEAKAFDFNGPVVFSSCFDDSLFEKIVKDKNGVKPPEEIRRLFREHGISDIYVDWGEIARFRSEGNYGFSDFITPNVFDELVRRGILIRNGNGNEAFRVAEESKSR